MTTWQFISVVGVPAAFLLKMIFTFIANRDKALVEKLPPNETLDSLMISVILSIILLIISTDLPEMRNKLGVLEKISPGDPLFRTIEHATSARTHIIEIADPAIKSILNAQLEQITDTYDSKLRALNESRATVAEDQVVPFAEAIFDNAGQSIDATSFVAPSDWWQGPEGKVYINHNAEAIRRGIRINRIFICGSKQELSAIEPILKLQTAVGIKVFTLLTAEIPNRLSKDIIILDNKLVGELQIDQGSRSFHSVNVSVAFSDVQRVRRSWEDLRAIAHPFPPSEGSR